MVETRSRKRSVQGTCPPAKYARIPEMPAECELVSKEFEQQMTTWVKTADERLDSLETRVSRETEATVALETRMDAFKDIQVGHEGCICALETRVQELKDVQDLEAQVRDATLKAIKQTNDFQDMHGTRLDTLEIHVKEQSQAQDQVVGLLHTEMTRAMDARTETTAQVLALREELARARASLDTLESKEPWWGLTCIQKVRDSIALLDTRVANLEAPNYEPPRNGTLRVDSVVQQPHELMTRLAEEIEARKALEARLDTMTKRFAFTDAMFRLGLPGTLLREQPIQLANTAREILGLTRVSTPQEISARCTEILRVIHGNGTNGLDPADVAPVVKNIMSIKKLLLPV